MVSAVSDGLARARVLENATRLVRDHGVNVDRRHGGDGLSYSVVTGDRILEDAGILSAMYTSVEMLEWIRALTDLPTLTRSPHRLSAVNVNCLTRAGQRYPWHRDAVPFTAILFVTSLPASAGGQLLVRSADGGRVSIPPIGGDLVLLDGARCPHAVAPLSIDVLRVTVPMVYPVAHVERPSGLDEYLYAS